MRNFLGFLLISLFLSGCAGPIVKQGDSIQYYAAKTGKPYDDGLDELKIAITEQNFRITHSRVGKVIRERGVTDFPDYDTIQFCNLSHAKTLLEIWTDAIRQLPCTMVLYSRNNQTIIEARLLPVDSDNPDLNKFSESINDILKQIVNFAAEI